jgi:hypothetical protein
MRVASCASRRERTAHLLGRHRRLLQGLARVPFVRLVALSGACAHGNATDDDVDVFLMVRRGRAWVVTGAIMAVSKLLGVRRTLCVNYVLDEDTAALPERDLVTASEIVGMRPLAGGEGYRRFVAANDWVRRFTPASTRPTWRVPAGPDSRRTASSRPCGPGPRAARRRPVTPRPGRLAAPARRRSRSGAGAGTAEAPPPGPPPPPDRGLRRGAPRGRGRSLESCA